MFGWGNIDGWRSAGLVRRLFPEREIFLRHGDGFRAVRLTSARQAGAAGVLSVVLGLALVSTAGVLGGGFSSSAGIKSAAYYERLLADRQARLAVASTRGPADGGAMEGLAREVEARHAALTLLLRNIGAGAAATPTVAAGRSVAARMDAIRIDQERLASAAESFGRERAERLRNALKVAGLEIAPAAGRALARGGPLIEAKDTKALAAALGVDQDFAARIRDAAAEMGDARAMSNKVERLPLAEPLTDPRLSSGFGFRRDPFNGHAAFHAGQDFAGGTGTPILVTAPGVVSFTGVRTGYGNVVEVTHAGGFMTRYAHLSAFAVRQGEAVAAGQRIAAMGSTGRSTGPHLHYEVWMNGRVQDPVRFLKAGRYVQQDS